MAYFCIYGPPSCREGFARLQQSMPPDGLWCLRGQGGTSNQSGRTRGSPD
jgi:hypothetical protein